MEIPFPGAGNGSENTCFPVCSLRGVFAGPGFDQILQEGSAAAKHASKDDGTNREECP